MLRERVSANIHDVASTLTEKGLKVKSIAEIKFGEGRNGHDSTAYTLCIQQGVTDYMVRVDHIHDTKAGDTLSIWYHLGRFNRFQMSDPQFLRVRSLWTRDHPDSFFTLGKSAKGDVIVGVKCPADEVNILGLAGTIQTLVNTIPEAQSSLRNIHN
jgi:hypothetical protein